MELIAQKLINKNSKIKNLINERLEYFSSLGLKSHFDYTARIHDLSQLNLLEVNFNRVLFNVLSYLLEGHKKDAPLEVSVRNNDKYLTINFIVPHGHTEGGLFSLKNGFSLLSSRKKTPVSFLAVQNLVRESGGRISLNAYSSRNTSYCLQIPLSPHPNSNKNSPPPKEISTYRFESKGALSEGAFRYSARKAS